MCVKPACRVWILMNRLNAVQLGPFVPDFQVTLHRKPDTYARVRMSVILLSRNVNASMLFEKRRRVGLEYLGGGLQHWAS